MKLKHQTFLSAAIQVKWKYEHDRNTHGYNSIAKVNFCLHDVTGVMHKWNYKHPFTFYTPYIDIIKTICKRWDSLK